MTDIVERLRAYPMSRTARLEDDAANEIERLRETNTRLNQRLRATDEEIERLREEAGYAKLMYDKRMAEKLTRAEEVIEVMRTHKQLHNPFVQDALATYDKERDSG